MNTRLALEIITTIGFYKNGACSTCQDVKKVWELTFPNKKIPMQKNSIDKQNEKSIDWEKAKLKLYEAAISYLVGKLDKPPSITHKSTG